MHQRFLPILRNVTPYAVGMKGMPYRRFAVYSYSASFVWTIGYFSLGMFVGDQVVDHIGVLIDRYGYYAAGIVAVLAIILIISWVIRRNKRSKGNKEIQFHG